MTVADIRAALTTALRTIPGLHVSPYMTDEIVVPHAMFDFALEPHLVFGRGADVYRFTVQVFASRSSDLPSQKYLDELRDPTNTEGLVRVIETDSTLAAAVDYARVTGISAVQIAPVKPNVEYLMIEATVEVVL